MSSRGFPDLQCLLHLFSTSPCASASLYISKFKCSLRAMIPSLIKPTSFGSICIVWSFSVSLHVFLSILSPGIWFVYLSNWPLFLLTSCQSLLLALRLVLLSTKLSSFIRLGGIRTSPPRTGLLPRVLLLPWGGRGKAIGWECLDEDGDGEGRCRGWPASTEVLLSGTSGALSMSLCFRQLAVVIVLGGRVAPLVGLGLPSTREILLSDSCGQIWQIKMNCSRLD